MMLTVDHGAAAPLYRQVIGGVRGLIDAGPLHPGQSLPSSRRLAEAARAKGVPVTVFS